MRGGAAAGAGGEQTEREHADGDKSSRSTYKQILSWIFSWTCRHFPKRKFPHCHILSFWKGIHNNVKQSSRMRPSEGCWKIIWSSPSRQVRPLHASRLRQPLCRQNQAWQEWLGTLVSSASFFLVRTSSCTVIMELYFCSCLLLMRIAQYWGVCACAKRIYAYMCIGLSISLTVLPSHQVLIINTWACLASGKGSVGQLALKSTLARMLAIYFCKAWPFLIKTRAPNV